MENTLKPNKGYFSAIIIAATIGCTASTSVVYGQQQSQEIPLHSHGPNAGDGYTEEDLLVPEPQSAEEIETPAVYTMPPEAEAALQTVNKKLDAYKRCVKDIIANDTPAVDKHDEMDVQCYTQRQQIVDTLSPELQGLMLLNVDRRIYLVLERMAEAEGVIDDSAEDIAEAITELSAEDRL